MRVQTSEEVFTLQPLMRLSGRWCARVGVTFWKWDGSGLAFSIAYACWTRAAFQECHLLRLGSNMLCGDPYFDTACRRELLFSSQAGKDNVMLRALLCVVFDSSVVNDMVIGISRPVRSRCECTENQTVHCTIELCLSLDKPKKKKQGRNEVSVQTSMSM